MSIILLNLIVVLYFFECSFVIEFEFLCIEFKFLCYRLLCYKFGRLLLASFILLITFRLRFG